ncbi:PfkB family carbohydrate kinase [uncultured Pseudokineococcus sp.]|uniref:PfkB family carbohydrate kinase n=1 Tax=uncultured Pseudokineococcus sp. TaxID=1642928 RepID=UPI0026154054|nr:PfkB family carbohydrate kinase [uncultured Pseudokineococcus sp.]
MADRSGVVVVGSANLDVVLGVDDVPQPGETVLARSRAEHVGGKGLNQAVAAARCGAATTFVGAVGDDAAGRRLRDALTAAGVAVRLRALERPTGTAFVTVAGSGENVIVVDPGANAGLVDLAPAELAAVRGAGHLLCQLEVPTATVAAAASEASAAGVVVVLNPSPVQPLPAGLLADVDVLLVNEHEAAALAGDGAGGAGADGAGADGDGADGDGAAGAGGDDADVVARARALARRLLEVVPRVVVTLGAAGALVVVRGGADGGVHVPGLPVPVVDTTGAGDVVAGALAAALEEARAGVEGRGAPDEERLVAAARRATAAAALSVQRPGASASAPRREEVEALLAGWSTPRP